MIRAAVVIAALALAPAGGAGAAPPAVALTASPAHVVMSGSDRRLIRVANPGAEPVVVDVEAGAFSLGARGRPQISRAGSRRAAAWLVWQPSRIALGPGASTEVVLASSPPPSAEPGDHAAVLLLTTRPGRPAVAVRMRLGVTVVVRVPGAVRHRLVVRSVRARGRGGRRVLELVIANRGNVVERLGPGRVSVTILAGRGRLVRLRPPLRDLLPRSSGTFELACPHVRGTVRVVVGLRLSPGARPIRARNYRLRL